MIIRPTNDLGQESFVSSGSISGGTKWWLYAYSQPGYLCGILNHSRRKIRLHAKVVVSLSLLFGLFENELLNIAVHLVLLHTTGDR